MARLHTVNKHSDPRILLKMLDGDCYRRRVSRVECDGGEQRTKAVFVNKSRSADSEIEVLEYTYAKYKEDATQIGA